MLSARLGSAGREKLLLLAHTLIGFALQHLEQQRQLGHFYGLGVDVHPENMSGEDAFLFRNRQPPLSGAGVLIDGLLVGFRLVFGVPFQAVVEKAAVRGQQE